MSSFTNNISITPTKDWLFKIVDGFSYYTNIDWKTVYIDVPDGYVFDGASIPYMFGFLFQRVEPDTIMSAWLHDYLYTDRREFGLWKSNTIFLESLIIYNIPDRLKDKEYLLAFCLIIKYSIMFAWLILWSWFVRYKLKKKFYKFIWQWIL